MKERFKNLGNKTLSLILITFILTLCLSLKYKETKTIDANILGIGTNNQLYLWENNAWKHIPNSGDVIDIAIMKNGTVVGIGKNEQLYTRGGINWKEETVSNDAAPSSSHKESSEKNQKVNNNTKWQNVSNSGNVSSVAIAKDGSILGIGKNKNIYKWKQSALSSAWEQIPNSGDVTDITVMNDGTILGVGTNKELYIRKDNAWKNIPNSGSVIDVAVTKDGTILGVGTNNKMYIWVKTDLSSSWEVVDNSEGIIAIAAK
ncbi:MAG: tectonin domain-containing protein [Polaribacter sp.]